MAQETITVGANSQQAVEVPGRFFACLSATGPFEIEVDHGGKRLCTGGVKFSFEPFKRIVFFETQGKANTITFYAGDAQYDGVVPNDNGAVPVFESGTATFDNAYLMDPDGSLLHITHADPVNLGTAIPLPAMVAIGGQNFQRKSFHIANRTPDDLFIYKSTGECVDIVLANTDRTFIFSFDVLLQFKTNAGSNNIALYYTLFSAHIMSQITTRSGIFVPPEVGKIFSILDSGAPDVLVSRIWFYAAQKVDRATGKLTPNVDVVSIGERTDSGDVTPDDLDVGGVLMIDLPQGREKRLKDFLVQSSTLGDGVWFKYWPA